MKYHDYKWLKGFGISIFILCMAVIVILTVPSASGQTGNPTPTWPIINRAANQIEFGIGRTPVWRVYWCDNYYGCGHSYNLTYINQNAYTNDGYYANAYTRMRWPGTDNGASKTIWFRTGYDDVHRLYINGQLVTSGDCCYYAYGSYTAKPGEIVNLQFYSNNYGGPYITEVAWDPDGDGVYTLLGGSDVGFETATEGGGSYWYSSDITSEQTNLINTTKTRLSNISLGNKIYIEEKIGTSGTIANIEQSGNYNLIQGLGGGNAIIDGDNNTINIKQGSVSGRNLIEFGVYGNINSVTIQQARNINTGAVTSPESGGHYTALGINGDSNTVSIKQRNDGGNTSGHFAFLYITGSNNITTIKQANDNEKKFFGTLTGDNNNLNITQQGLGNHYLDLLLTGNGHTANITQQGNATQKATINLQNAGGASNLTLVQQGNTGQTYSILQQCANLQGCSVTVTQGNP